MTEAANPPSTNRGVTNPKPQTLERPFFDWFQGMITGEFQAVQASILKAFDGFYDDLRSTQYGHKGVFVQRGWQHGLELVRDGRVILNLAYGGQNSQHGVFYKATGHSAKGVASILQDVFNTDLDMTIATPELTLMVSRVDVAFDAIGSFESVIDQVIPVTKDLGLKVSQAGDWITGGEDGRTLYIHMNKDTKMRIYEKGKEQRIKGEDPEAPLDWIRFEIETHSPKGKQNKLFKRIMAGQTPKAIYQSFAPFVSVTQAAGFGDLRFEHIQKTLKPELTDSDQKDINMINQYGSHLLDRFSTPDQLRTFLSKLYPDPDQLPKYLRPFMFDHVEQVNYLRHGEY